MLWVRGPVTPWLELLLAHFTEMQSRCGPERGVLIWGSVGEITLAENDTCLILFCSRVLAASCSLPANDWAPQFLDWCWLEPPSAPRSCPQVLVLWIPQHIQQERESPGWMQVTHSLSHLCFLLVRSKSPVSKGRVLHKGGDHGAPLVSVIRRRVRVDWASLVAQMVKNLPAMWETWVQVPGSGRFPGGRHGNPLQYSCLENPMDRGACELQSMGSQRVRHDLVTEQQQWVGDGGEERFSNWQVPKVPKQRSRDW